MQTAEEILTKYKQVMAQYQKNKDEKDDLEMQYDEIKSQIDRIESDNTEDSKMRFLIKIFMIVLSILAVCSGSELIFLLVKGEFSSALLFAIIFAVDSATIKMDLTYLKEHKPSNEVTQPLPELKDDEKRLKEELTKKYSLCDSLEKEANDYYHQYERLVTNKVSEVTDVQQLLPISTLTRTKSITK